MLYSSPFLKIAVTLATFSLPGKTPVDSDELKILIRGIFSSL